MYFHTINKITNKNKIIRSLYSSKKCVVVRYMWLLIAEKILWICVNHKAKNVGRTVKSGILKKPLIKFLSMCFIFGTCDSKNNKLNKSRTQVHWIEVAKPLINCGLETKHNWESRIISISKTKMPIRKCLM